MAKLAEKRRWVTVGGLCEFMDAAGLVPVDVARQAGLSRSTVYDVDQNHRATARTRKKLAKVLNLTTFEINQIVAGKRLKVLL